MHIHMNMAFVMSERIILLSQAPATHVPELDQLDPCQHLYYDAPQAQRRIC
jgi:hypothetical protein